MGYPTYEIKTVADFLKVPEDRMEACLSDFVHCLHTARHTINLIKITAEEMACKPLPDCMYFTSFIWTDDGEKVAHVQFIEAHENEDGSVSSHPVP